MDYAEVAQIRDVQEFSEGVRAVRSEMASVPYRPGYHFLTPTNWMNDPNGTIFWKGRYHLFYQHNPNGPYHGTIHWGHAVSEDLVHWRDLPIALFPNTEGADERGCYSGTAFINKDGIPTIIYHGLPHGICIATSSDDMLLNWEKHPDNPVIPNPGADDEYMVTGAPCAWVEGDTYYALTGNSGDTVPLDRTFLFRSKDLAHWEYMHTFYEGGRLTEQGEDCAVPDFFPLGEKHMLLFASHSRGAQYYLGTYAGNRFIPEVHERMQFATVPGRRGVFCEALTLADGDGRRILFGRIAEGRYDDIQLASGWSGVCSLPRVLSLSDEGTLRIEPAPEFDVLRRDHQHFSEIHIGSNSTVRLEGVRGNSLEIAAVLEGESAEEFGLKVCCSPGGEEQTLIRYRHGPWYGKQKVRHPWLVLDLSRSSANPDVRNREPQMGPLRLPGLNLAFSSGQVLSIADPIELRAFVDRSVVEVFANGVQCLTGRIYPDRPDSLGVELFARGGDAKLRSMDVWQMAPIWPVA